MKKHLAFVLIIAVALGAVARESLATSASDPAGDFLSTYTGPQAGDVDVLSSDVIFNPGSNTLTFMATFNAPVNTTAGALYVWGLDRGAGFPAFVGGTPSIGQGVLFDSVFIAVPSAGVGVVNLLDGTSGTTLPGVVTVSGNSVAATVSAALFPSLGKTTDQYMWNLWPRVGSDSTNNAQISDFAPDASDLPVTIAPEPGSLALVALGALALAVRRRASAR
jgi:PEP-CTERM motif-containing protein